MIRGARRSLYGVGALTLSLSAPSALVRPATLDDQCLVGRWFRSAIEDVCISLNGILTSGGGGCKRRHRGVIDLVDAGVVCVAASGLHQVMIERFAQCPAE